MKKITIPILRKLKKDLEITNTKKDLDIFKKIICDLIGHSPFINYWFGEISCRRCDAVLGHTIANIDRINDDTQIVISKQKLTKKDKEKYKKTTALQRYYSLTNKEKEKLER